MRKTPRQQRSSFTVEVILEVAAQLLDREGGSLTTNRIADLAGVSVGTIYQYFDDKTAIFNELARRHLADGAAAVSEVLDRRPVGSGPWPTVVGEVVTVVVAENRTHGAAHGRLRELVDSATLADDYRDFLELMARRLAEHLAADGYREDTALDAARLAIIGLDGQVHQQVRTDADSDDVAARLTDYLVGGLRAFQSAPS